jgi:lysyl-tRNA synthetase class 2
MDELIQRRVERLSSLLQKGVDPFLETSFRRTSFSSEIREKHKGLSNGEETKIQESIAGRIFSIRVQGGVAFVDMADSSGKIQLLFRKDVSQESFDFLVNYLDEGDIVGVNGNVLRTKRGEISLGVNKLRLLSKSLRPLPSEWFGLKDTETRYRQRYLDMIMNKEVRDALEISSRLVNGMREYMLSQNFVEVNTPILQPIYGGAFAQPFKTHHNFLKQDMFLRVAPELYLKKMIVGGFDRVFEFAPCFRNESVDTTHNPEFIQMEAYQAFADYEDMMKLVENVISFAVKKILGTTKVNYQGHEIDFKAPWKRMKMEEAIEAAGLKISRMNEAEIIEKAKSLGLKHTRLGEAVEDLFSEMAQKTTVQPTFITHFPSDISPLAKKFPDDRSRAQRFEAYAAGVEIGNAFSELNNPVEQYARFKEEEELRKKLKAKDLEYMPMDRDYIRALEYGMPPAGGLGMGIARIAGIILNRTSIKEVIPFPAISSNEKIKTVSEMFPKLAKKYE